MRKILFLFLLATPFLFTQCSKKSSSSTPTEQEENLVIALDPDPGGAVVRSLTASYDFKLLIQSKIPTAGLEVAITYRKDADNTVLYSQTLQVSATPINLSVNNISAETGTVTVDVKSKSKATNTASKSFKLARK